jgi:hypothetical protein
MKCVNCGAELYPGDKFCGECGAPQRMPSPEASLPERPQAWPVRPPTTAPSPPAAPPTGKALPWPWIVTGCGGLLIVGLIVIAVVAVAAPQVLPSFSMMPQPPEAPAMATQVAADIYATQTAAVPAATVPPPVPTADPTSTPTAQPTATPTPSPTPPFSIQPYDSQRDADAERVTLIRFPEQGPSEPGHYRWEGVVPAGKPVLVDMAWCTGDEQTLETNWSSMQYELTIDDLGVDADPLIKTERMDDMVCRAYRGVLAGWSPGRHSWVWTQHIYQEINDGWDTYQPGDYVMEYAVEVVSGLEDDFSDTSGGWTEGEYEDDKLWIEGGEYHISMKTKQRFASFAHKGDRYADLLLAADARHVSDLPGEYGLAFRYQDPDNYYCFRISDDGHYSVVKRVAGERIDIVEWTSSSAINQGQEGNSLAVVCEGDNISVYANRRQLTTINDDSFAEGYIGVVVGSFGEPDVHVAFDRIWVGAVE